MPVEVHTLARSPISLYFETNGTLTAEQDVDLVARAAGPIIELETEEGRFVEKGQLLARIDDSEIRSQVAVAEVQLTEARAIRDRVVSLFEDDLLSREELDRANASYETALGDVARARIQLEYTIVRAPFAGQIVRRYVRFAEFVGANAPLFRISDFDPLLCPIQVPERELSRLRVGQPATLEVEAWSDERFEARVLRLSPVIDADTGTIRVTLEVSGRGKLRPGMFASVFLELETRPDALVVPKAGLALDSLGDAVYVVEEGTAHRRSVTLGFQSAGLLEVVEGLSEGQQVVVVGQDGLSDGTPVEVVSVDGARVAQTRAPSGSAGDRPPGDRAAGGPPGGAASSTRGPRGPGGPGGVRIDFDDPKAVERAKGFMRQRGLSDEQIEERLERMRQRQQDGGGDGDRP